MSSLLAQINIGEAFKLKDNLNLSNEVLSSPRAFLSAILPNALVFAGLILLLLIVGGSLSLIFTAGDPEAQQKSQGVVTNAALGFALVFAAYWIIQIIQVITGIPILGS